MKTIKLPVFNCIIYVFFDEDVETAIKKIEKKISQYGVPLVEVKVSEEEIEEV